MLWEHKEISNFEENRLKVFIVKQVTFGWTKSWLKKKYKCVGWEVEANFGIIDSSISAQKWEKAQETFNKKYESNQEGGCLMIAD